MATAVELDKGGRIWRALSVLPDERPKVLLTGATFFVLLASASIGLNAADTLFFVRFGVDSLPWMIMLSGLVVMAVTIVHAAAQAALGTRFWAWAITLVFAGLVAAERAAVAADVPWIYPIVWLTGQVVIYVGFTVLWDVAGELADTRQAKRLFPLFMSAGIAGSVTGNALTGPLAGLLGTENLLIVEAVGLGLAGVIARLTTRRFVARRGSEAKNAIHDLGAGLQTTLRVPLFRLVAGVGAALSILFFLVFFPFSEVAAASFDTEESLAAFLGWFSSAATAATFLVSLFVVKRLFTRLGVVAVLLIVAVLYVAGFSMWLFALGLFTATLFRGVQWIAINALGATAFNSLFNVLTGSARTQTRDFVAAVPVQLGTIVAGVLLLLGGGLSDTSRTILSLALAVAFLFMVLPMRAAYSAALVEAVRHGLSDVFTAPMPGMQKPRSDADSLNVLLSAASGENPARRRVAAAILAEIGSRAATDELRRLLEDSEPEVRLEALMGLAELGSESIMAEALGLLDDDDVEVRRCAIKLLQHDQAGHHAVHEALEDGDCEVRANAARIVGGLTGRRVIEEMMDTGDPEAMTAALRCVVAEPDLAHVDPRRYTSHGEAEVRARAAELLALRHDSGTVLRTLTDDPSAEVRLAAARSLARVDRSALHDVLEHGTVRAREAALEAMVAGSERDEYLTTWAEGELDRAAELHRLRIAIESRRDGASSAAEYLTRVLEIREHMVERWVVTALGNEQTRAALSLVARGAISGGAAVKAEALEALESITDRGLARRLIALLEDPGAGPPPDRPRALRELASDHQPWFRALALRTMFEEFGRDLEAAGAEAAADDSELVREAVPQTIAQPVSDGRGLTLLDKVLLLQQASLFENLDPEDLATLGELTQERRCDPGDVVYELGSPGDELMVVVAGGVVVSVVDNGRHRVLATRGPGEPIGELGVLRRQPRMADVIAGPEGLHAITIGDEDFVSALEEHPGIATALLAKLADRIATTVDVAQAGGTAPNA